MLVTLPHDLHLFCAATGASSLVRKGKRQLEEIPNPLGFPGPMARWWVLQGTTIGAAKGYWLAALNNGKPAQA